MRRGEDTQAILQFIAIGFSISMFNFQFIGILDLLIVNFAKRVKAPGS